MKRIHLLFDRISSLLLSERDLQGIPFEALRTAKYKAKNGDYFIKSSVKGYEIVDWESIERDVRAGFISVAPGMMRLAQVFGPLLQMEYAMPGGTVDFGTEAERQESVSGVVRMLQLIVSSREYQFT